MFADHQTVILSPDKVTHERRKQILERRVVGFSGSIACWKGEHVAHPGLLRFPHGIGGISTRSTKELPTLTNCADEKFRLALTCAPKTSRVAIVSGNPGAEKEVD